MAKNKTNIKPLHDRIILRRDEPESVTDSGIFLPESSKDKPKTGVVEAVGDGALNTETGQRIPRGDLVVRYLTLLRRAAGAGQ